MPIGSEAFGDGGGAEKAELFASGEHESDVAIFQRTAERPGGRNESCVTDAIVEAAAVGARAEQRAIGFGNCDGVADFDAELFHFFRRASAHIHANHGGAIGWPLEI